MIGTYNRLNLHVGASDVMVIRAVRRRLLRNAKTRDYRTHRHELYRIMLRHHADARRLFKEWRF